MQGWGVRGGERMVTLSDRVLSDFTAVRDCVALWVKARFDVEAEKGRHRAHSLRQSTGRRASTTSAPHGAPFSLWGPDRGFTF